MKSHDNIGTLLAWGRERLGKHSPGAALDAELLLAACAGLSRAQLRATPEHEPTAAQIDRYGALIERRRGGEPLAYLTGRREFWSLSLAVTPAVLVPRPETELVVERALALCGATHCRALDLGTGSGAIALALASERPAWEITATDASDDALAVAQTNARELGLGRVRFLQGSWFEPVAGGRFELIVSNPPYVDAGDAVLGTPELRHEPRCALTPGPDGLAALHALVRQAPDFLEHDGWLVLEHGTRQAASLGATLVAQGFTHVRCHRDLAGHERVTEAHWHQPRKR
ncbi:MAG: peptide chain release factor N(5)-glutamine methyltransferase [Gammaproteobacteria bacterium]|nr:peptide chain release factor N(5)-glutamine methyltransferase [Gammaproteobacteria bacterium]